MICTCTVDTSETLLQNVKNINAQKEEEEDRDLKGVYFCCFIKCDIFEMSYVVDLMICELRLTRIVQKYFCTTAQMCICTVLAYSVCMLYDGTVIIYVLCNGLKVINDLLSWYFFFFFCMTKNLLAGSKLFIFLLRRCVQGCLYQGWSPS